MSFLFASSSEGEPVAPRLSPVKSSIEEANKHIQALCERVAQLEAEKDALSEHFQQKQTELESLRQTMDHCQEKLSHRDIQTKNLELTAASREEIILELESHVVAHQRELHAKSEALTSLEILLAEKETVYERVSSKVAEYQRILEVKNQLLEAATDAARTLEAEMEARLTDIDILVGKVAELEEENQRLEEENQRLKKAEGDRNRSVAALGKILSYSSSMEGLVGMLKEAAALSSEGEAMVNETAEVEATATTASDVENVTQPMVNGWSHCSSEERLSVEEEREKETEEVVEEPLDFENRDGRLEEQHSVEQETDKNTVPNYEENDNVTVVVTASVETQGDAEGIAATVEPFDLASFNADHSLPVDAEIISEEEVVHDSSSAENVKTTIDNSNLVCQEALSPTSASKVPTRKRGDDRIASILLFDSGEALVEDDRENEQLENVAEEEELEEQTVHMTAKTTSTSVGDQIGEVSPAPLDHNGYYMNGFGSAETTTETAQTNAESISHSTEFFV